MKSGTILLLVSLYLLNLSCTNENDLLQVKIGDNFIGSQTNIVMMDSFKVNMSTVLIDSVSTSGTGKLLVGKYTDKYLGDISSIGFFQLDKPEDLTINEESIFDSITLILNYDGISYGDTLLPQVINVHRVNEDIEVNDDYSLYNSSSFNYDELPIGSLSFYPKPNFQENIEIRLDDSLGVEFLNLMINESDEISSSEDFIEYFKGLAIVPGENNSCIISFEGIDSLVNMRLYTHYVDKERAEVSYDFSMYSTSTCFNQICADCSGTSIENLTTQREEKSSNETGEMTFIQGGLGLLTRVDFPGLGRMLEMDYRYILYKAELVLKPYPNAYLPDELPDEILLYNTDKNNNLVSETTDDDGETVYADFYLDEIYNENTYFNFDVTSAILSELSDGYVDVESGFIIALPEEKRESTLDRLAFDARNGLSFKPTLKLYYIFYY